ncbi:hypothetical protein PtB15_6B258 [Puccinia triticina]|nr:hypothetical protein PtB15_6B258 [Puccinia triticina]
MRLSRLAWNSVTRATIENCWKHTGITSKSDEVNSTNNKNTDVSMNLAQTELETKATRLEALRIVNKTNQMLISELLNPIGETQEYGLLSPDEVFQLHQESNSNDIEVLEDEPPPVPKPTIKEIL